MATNGVIDSDGAIIDKSVNVSRSADRIVRNGYVSPQSASVQIIDTDGTPIKKFVNVTENDDLIASRCGYFHVSLLSLLSKYV